MFWTKTKKTYTDEEKLVNEIKSLVEQLDEKISIAVKNGFVVYLYDEYGLSRRYERVTTEIQRTIKY